MAKTTEQCQAPGCDEAATHLISGSLRDGAEVRELGAFVDAVGNALVTSEQAKLSASGWLACDDHDRLDVVTLPAWWRSAPESTRQAVRDCDYLTGDVPPELVVSLARTPGAVKGSQWVATEPVTYSGGSDVLRALDAAERPADA